MKERERQTDRQTETETETETEREVDEFYKKMAQSCAKEKRFLLLQLKSTLHKA